MSKYILKILLVTMGLLVIPNAVMADVKKDCQAWSAGLDENARNQMSNPCGLLSQTMAGNDAYQPPQPCVNTTLANYPIGSPASCQSSSSSGNPSGGGSTNVAPSGPSSDSGGGSTGIVNGFQ